MPAKQTTERLEKRIKQLAKEESMPKEVGDDLRISERTTRLIIDNVPALVSYIGKGGYYRFVNKTGAEWFGITRNKIIGKHLRDILGKTPYEMIKQYVRAALSGQRVRYETALPLKHGGARWVIADLVPYIDDQGKPNGYFGLVTDITERKIAEELLLESERKFRALFENSRNGIFIIDKDGKILDVNQAALDLFQFSREDILGMNFNKFYIDPEKRKIFQKQMVEKGFVKDFYNKLRKKDGTGVDCLVTVTERRSADGTLLSYQCIVRDVTEQRKAVNDLKEQILRNNLFLQNATDGFFIIDTKRKILEANQAASLILGYSTEELLNSSIDDIEVLDDSQHARSSFTRPMKKKAERFESFLKRKDGQIICVEFSNSFIKMEKTDLFYSFFYDITEKKRARETLLKREEELKTKTCNLEEVNTALRVLLKKRDEDKIELEEEVIFNTKEMVLPYVIKLKESRLDTTQTLYLEIIESHLHDIISPFASKLSSKYFGLTPMEIRIANLVKQARTNKEIAELFQCSPRTIAFHRDNIRKKLGLKNQKMNLEVFLLSMQ